MVWDLVIISWFCELCYGVIRSEGDSNVSVFKQVGDSAYVWGDKGESCPLWAVFSACGRGGECDARYSVLYLAF